MGEIGRFIQSIVQKGLESLGRYYSSYRAIVADVDDPDNLGRIKAVIPKVSGVNMHPKWIYPKGMPQGNNFGFNWPLKKGDMVWVEFEFGDPGFPYWSYGHYATGEKPEVLTNDTYGFITPMGYAILVNEKDKTLKVKGNDGLEILIDSQNKIKISNSHADLGTELINLITAIQAIILTSPAGPTTSPPVNNTDFVNIKTNLSKLLS
jgi:hypothetical protein